MRSVVLGLTASVAIVSLFAIQPAPVRTNVYINGMGGFGSYLAAAFRVKEVPVVVVADRRQADFEVMGTAESKEPDVAHSLLNQSGSSERASVNMVNLKTGEVVFAYAYDRSYALFGRKSAAESCAKHLRTAILKGEVDLRAAAVGAGHHAGETTAVPPGEPDTNASIPPARQLLPVAIASDPPGARIEVENIFAGKTPATIKLQPGEYRVTLTLAGYESWSDKILVEAGSPSALAATLKKTGSY
jgi:PEGA domain-containing protein